MAVRRVTGPRHGLPGRYVCDPGRHGPLFGPRRSPALKQRCINPGFCPRIPSYVFFVFGLNDFFESQKFGPTQ